MSSDGPLSGLVLASHLMAPDDLASVVATQARRLGVQETVLYMADYAQTTLVPLTGNGVPERQDLPIDGTLAGRAFTRVELVGGHQGEGGHRSWMPLLDCVERLGVAEFVSHQPLDSSRHEQLWAFVGLVAELIITNDAHSDVFARRRRCTTLSLAAEIQWELLPPLSFATEQVVITGGLEPAYDIGGDSFDYAVNEGTADLLVLDAVGHGLPAAILAGAAIGAYRRARRNRLDLPEIAREMDAVIAAQFTGSQFVTALIARLDLASGRMRWINAGHPDPLVVRGTALVHPPACPPARPLGLQEGTPHCCQTRLQPGDRLLLHTDGITEARAPTGPSSARNDWAGWSAPPPRTASRPRDAVPAHARGAHAPGRPAARRCQPRHARVAHRPRTALPALAYGQSNRGGKDRCAACPGQVTSRGRPPRPGPSRSARRKAPFRLR